MFKKYNDTPAAIAIGLVTIFFIIQVILMAFTGESSRFSRLKDWRNPGPVLCHRQVIIDEKDSQDGEHGPAEYTDPEGSHVANTCSCFLGCSHDAKRKEGAGLTPRPIRIMLLRNQLSNSKNLVS